MPKLTAVRMKERGEELKPARLLAFNLWEENKQITAAELDQALKEKGFEVGKSTRVAWLIRFKKRASAIRTHAAKQRTGPKPRPARLLAFKLWQENPQITGAELGRALQEQGFQPKRSVYSWLKSFRKGKDVGTYEEKPATAVALTRRSRPRRWNQVRSLRLNKLSRQQEVLKPSACSSIRE